MVRQAKIIYPFSSNSYVMPTTVYFGRGQLSILHKLLKNSSQKKFLFIAGKHFFEDPQYQLFCKDLERSGKVSFYNKKITKSSFEEVNLLVGYTRRGKFDGIIGLGGGAILDSAKVAAVLSQNGGLAEDYLVKKTQTIDKKGILYIAIPTTSGTGSEVTPWSVIWGDKKYSLSSPEFMFPDIAIVDPALTDNCPRSVTAAAGIDAMVQAVEAYWNIKHNAKSDEYALESIRTVFSSLERAVNSPDLSSRNKMAWGSLTGGLAFSNNSTTLCHSVSYPMTSHWGVVHGQATSITLPSLIEYSFTVLGVRQKDILSAFGVDSAGAAAQKVLKLMKAIGLKTKLSQLGIPKEGIDVIVKEGFDPTRAGNAPRVPTPQELKQMLLQIY